MANETRADSNADYPAYPSGDFRSVQPVYGLTKREALAAKRKLQTAIKEVFKH